MQIVHHRSSIQTRWGTGGGTDRIETLIRLTFGATEDAVESRVYSVGGKYAGDQNFDNAVGGRLERGVRGEWILIGRYRPRRGSETDSQEVMYWQR